LQYWILKRVALYTSGSRKHNSKGEKMNRKPAWFMALLVAALVVAACGPTMATPTPSGDQGAGTVPTAVAASPTTAQAQPTTEAVSPGDLPVSADDWHVLGPADAKVTMIEYSDFQ
jgi:protein-disulfide isomerase